MVRSVPWMITVEGKPYYIKSGSSANAIKYAMLKYKEEHLGGKELRPSKPPSDLTIKIRRSNKTEGRMYAEE